MNTSYKLAVLAQINERAKPPVLIQNQIVEQFQFTTPDEVADFFENQLAYPRPQSNKYETFSFIGCHFGYTDTDEVKFVDGAFRRVHVEGWLRRGEMADDHLTLLGFDVDNTNEKAAQVSTSEVDDVMGMMGRGVAWNSYSHSEQRHKNRVVMFPSRPVTWEEHLRIFALLDWHLLRGQGGRLDLRQRRPPLRADILVGLSALRLGGGRGRRRCIARTGGCVAR